MVRKLKSQSGASLLVSLLVFLICAMVGAAVIAAASAGVQHIQSRHEEQREYFSLSSAAKLLTEGTQNLKYETYKGETKLDEREEKIESEETTLVNSQPYPDYVYSNKGNSGTVPIGKPKQPYEKFRNTIYPNITTVTEINWKPTVTATPENAAAQALKTTIEKLANDIAAHNKTNPAETGYTTNDSIELTADEKNGVLPVKAEITMNQDYSVEIKLTIDSEKAQYVPFVLKLSASVSEDKTDRIEVNQEIEPVTLRKFALFSPGNSKNYQYRVDKQSVSYTFNYINVYRVTTVSWYYASLSKGSE